MKILKKELALYLGIHPQNVGKYYQSYIDILGLKRNWLTPYDIAKVDEIPVQIVCERLNITI
ncbi:MULTISPECIES: hypothetical protein [Galbibacter]|uniref:hypothetical protein n=1 Tax=Galbibacter orientalis TaxID=453852 RepID=UPI003002AEF8